MIKIKLERNTRNQPIFKLRITDEDIELHKLIKRALIESKQINGEYNYNVPIRFFEVIFKNTPQNQLEIDESSILSYLEFSDDYDENYYYILDVNARYMKKWRDEGCPSIYKISIDLENKSLYKEIVFKKLKVLNN